MTPDQSGGSHLDVEHVELVSMSLHDLVVLPASGVHASIAGPSRRSSIGHAAIPMFVTALVAVGDERLAPLFLCQQ